MDTGLFAGYEPNAAAQTNVGTDAYTAVVWEMGVDIPEDGAHRVAGEVLLVARDSVHVCDLWKL